MSNAGLFAIARISLTLNRTDQAQRWGALRQPHGLNYGAEFLRLLASAMRLTASLDP